MSKQKLRLKVSRIFDEHRKRMEKAEAACAAKDAVLRVFLNRAESMLSCDSRSHSREDIDLLRHLLSDECGKGYFKDDPECDGTDLASAAWWRGADHGGAMTVRVLNEVLDGKTAGVFSSPELETLKRRLMALQAACAEKDATIKWLNENTNTLYPIAQKKRVKHALAAEVKCSRCAELDKVIVAFANEVKGDIAVLRARVNT